MVKKPRRRIIRRRGAGGASGLRQQQQIPTSITENRELILAMAALPLDYDFEVFKTVWRIEQQQEPPCRHVALQMPEGLLMYACTIADVLKRFCTVVDTVSVMGDVTYGACCVDDLGARALGADLLVHYGHSCLVPLTKTVLKCLYVFVEIRLDVRHLVDCVCETIAEGTEVEVMGTVQFRAAVTEAATLLTSRHRPAHVPQAKPLSPGEVLGCTAPGNLATMTSTRKVMLFVADGRFHLEAAMIANPTLAAYRYDPYGKHLTLEAYDTPKMKTLRHRAIGEARDAKVFGIILGTLGRQGNPAILAHVRRTLKAHNRKSFVLLLSEIFPQKLNRMPHVDAWVQVACPRLSVDWGHFFHKPVLTAYEMEVCLGMETWRDVYPMDFYSAGSGEWSNYTDTTKGRVVRT